MFKKIIGLVLVNLCICFNAFAQSNMGTQPALENAIDVGSPGFQKIKIALPSFAIDGGHISITTHDALDFSKRFQEILDFTNWFAWTPESAFVSKKNLVLSPFKALDWSIIKTDYVVFGKFTPSENANKFNLELRLYNVKLQNLMVGKIYNNLNQKMVDLALRRFGDVLLNTLTGIPGPFMSNIAFVGKGTGQGTNIYVADFDGHNAKPITFNHSINISPSWSPDGTKVTYTSFATGIPQIYQYNLLTNKTIRMTFGTGSSSGASWSSDGQTIAFSSSTKQAQTHIFTMNAYGGDLKKYISISEIVVEPSYSPNGKYLAFTSNRYGKPMIFIRNLQTNLDNRLTFAGWYNASANWSPSSETLSFASYDRKIDRWDIFKINADGTHLERLTLSQGDNEKPSWSPDGRFILFQTTRGGKIMNSVHTTSKLYVMSQDGVFQHPLDISIQDARQPAWGPRIEQIAIDN